MFLRRSQLNGEVRGGYILRVLLPTQLDLICEQAEDAEKTGQCAPALDFVDQLISIHIFVVPRASLEWRLSSSREYLNGSVYDTIEIPILIERDTVSCNESSGL